MVSSRHFFPPERPDPPKQRDFSKAGPPVLRIERIESLYFDAFALGLVPIRGHFGKMAHRFFCSISLMAACAIATQGFVGDFYLLQWGLSPFAGILGK